MLQEVVEILEIVCLHFIEVEIYCHINYCSLINYLLNFFQLCFIMVSFCSLLSLQIARVVKNSPC